MSAKHWKSWSRKRWKACTNSPCRWLWKSASDQTGGTWTESHLKIEPAIPRQVRQIANQPFPASQNFPGNTSRPDLSTRTGTPYGTSFEALRSSEEDHMLRWPRVVDWGESMRRICEFLFVPALVLCITGCSGLSDVKNSCGGAGQATGVTVSPAAASVDPFTTQSFSAQVQGSTNQAVTWQVNGVTGVAAPRLELSPPQGSTPHHMPFLRAWFPPPTPRLP